MDTTINNNTIAIDQAAFNIPQMDGPKRLALPTHKIAGRSRRPS